MTEQNANPNKLLFECLAQLYKQGQLLLLDADRVMGERGWEPVSTKALSGFSSTINSPERWYARYAARFYLPTTPDEETTIDLIPFVSIHFTSDHDTNVDEPVVATGRLRYTDPMTVEIANTSFAYWMCKYWYKFPPLEDMEGWRGWRGQGQFCPNMKAAETFAVPLYDITSSEKLQELVINPLLETKDQPTN